MNRILDSLRWITAIVAVAAIGWGEHTASAPLTWAGAGAIAAVAILIGSGKWRRVSDGCGGEAACHAASPAELLPAATLDADPPDDRNLDSVVEQMLADGRFALLMRPQIACTLCRTKCWPPPRANSTSKWRWCPTAKCNWSRTGFRRLAEIDVADEALQRVTIRVAAAYLDRYPVTNRQYQAFVAAGGYEQMAIWDPAIWPAVLDFVDTTGKPGPRFWIDGRCLPGTKIIRWSASVGMRPSPMPAGSAADCRATPNGSRRRVGR